MIAFQQNLHATMTSVSLTGHLVATPRQPVVDVAQGHVLGMPRLMLLLQTWIDHFQTRPRGYKTFFMLNSVEHEILNAHMYRNIKKFGFF